MEKVAALEEAIYDDSSDPMLNWDENDLKRALEAGNVFEVQMNVEKRSERRLISSEQLDRWLTLEPQDSGRTNYLARLREGGLTDRELLEVSARYRRSLLDQEVSWHLANAYLLGCVGEA